MMVRIMIPMPVLLAIGNFSYCISDRKYKLLLDRQFLLANQFAEVSKGSIRNNNNTSNIKNNRDINSSTNTN